MLKEHNYIFQRANMAADCVLTGLAVLGAHYLRNYVLAPYFFPDLFREPSRLQDYAWLIWALPLVMVASLAYNGYYSSQRIRTFWETCRIIAVSAAITTVVAMGFSFLFVDRPAAALSSRPSSLTLGDNVSRGVLLLVPAVLFLLVAAKTWLVRRFLVGLRRRGLNYRSLLLVGSGETLRQFIALVHSHPFWGFKIVGIIDDSGREAKVVSNHPVVGALSSLWSYLDAHPVDEVVFIPARRSLEELTPYFEGCEEMGVRTRLALNFFRHTIAHPVLDSYQGVPVVTYSPTREINTALLFKYAFDRVAAFAALLLLSPVFLVTAILVKATSRSWSDPIFYGQIRSGLNGKPFRMWKFRSMYVNADKELEKLRAANEMGGPVFKMKHDPRITPVGRWLRKLSIDELPQLWNVLVGDMSLVGPRPPLPSEVARYDRWQRRRLSMKPGITCLWQVNGRNHLSFDRWMQLDLEYIDNWSLGLDFKILFKTVYVVATGYGAM